MQGTLVYGLGRFFDKHKERILREYDITGYCDRDEGKINKCPLGGVKIEDLRERHKQFKEILVAIDMPAMNVISDLIENLKIPCEKIRVYAYQQMISEGMVTFHGGWNEDAVLMLVFQMMNYSLGKIRYLEIGTNDPVLYNNSFNLYRAGARGVLVDPLAAVGVLAKAARPGDKFIRAAVVDVPEVSSANFYTSENNQTSSLSTKWINSFPHGDKIHTLTVPVIGINNLLDEIGFLPDLLLIDAEGDDARILTGINYGLYRPAVIIAELGKTDRHIVEFMNERGYDLFSNIKNTNTIFVRKDIWDNKTARKVRHHL